MRYFVFIRLAKTWWRIGAILHLMWVCTLLYGLACLDSIANWISAHHPGPLPGSSNYALAGTLLLQGILIMFGTGVLCFVLAGVLQWRENRIETRIKRGLCPKCAYPVGTNEVCTECGAVVVVKPR